MLDKHIRASLAHILLALINADNVIDQGEIMQFAKLKKKHGITSDDILCSDTMSFTQAVNNIVEYARFKNDHEFLKDFYEDAKAMTTSDGLCAQCEARILYALKSIFFNPTGKESDTGVRLIARKENTIHIDGPKVFFVRETIHTELSKNFTDYFQEYYYEFLNFGFELINVAHITDELISMGEDNVLELMSIGRPDMIKPKASAIYKELTQLTPQDVFKEILDGSLDVDGDGITTYFLIKICDSHVSCKDGAHNYYNFIRVPVVSDSGMKNVIRNIVNDYSDCAAQINPIILPADFNKFRYFSFTKSLFKMLEAEVERKEKGLRRLIIDAVDMKIYLEGLLTEGINVQYKQLALYILISWLSSKNMLLIRKGTGAYYENKHEGYVKSYIELADDKFVDIQKSIMKYEKDFEDPCSTLSQEFGDLKKKLFTALQNEAKSQCQETYDMCIPLSEKRKYPSTIERKDGKKEFVISGYVVNLPASYIYVRAKGKKQPIPIENLFE